MLILYITYIDFGTAKSGSSVRPQKMYEAFMEEGHEVKLLSGSQNNSNRKNRIRAIRETEAWLMTNKPDLCYVESPTYPILLRQDIRLLKKIHKMGVPVGYFYRDFYWKFPDLYPRRTDLSGRWKDRWLDNRQKRTDRTLQTVADVVYFPSKEAADYFSFARTDELPPAGTVRLTGGDSPADRTCIYVGGLSGGYGGETLLKAFQLLNSAQEQFDLILVCRKKEWKNYAEKWEKAPWLCVIHAEGEALEQYYRKAGIALLPVQSTPYTDIAMNVKLFEYLSYGLPVVTAKAKAVSRFVTENDVGISVEENPQSLAEGVRYALESEERLQQWRDNVKNVLLNGNLWGHRVKKIVSDLGELE